MGYFILSRPGPGRALGPHKREADVNNARGAKLESGLATLCPVPREVHSMVGPAQMPNRPWWR